MTIKRICAECGSPYERQHTESRCQECNPKPTAIQQRQWEQQKNKGSAHQRGYDYRWARLSKRARALQPYCSDCGSPHNLTADHSIEAWARRDRGLPIRLQDIDVVCQDCNHDRGPARGPDATDEYRTATTIDDLDHLAADYIDDDLDQRVARGEIDP